MLGRIVESLGYVQTWIWIWGVAGTSTVGVLIWAYVGRLPGVLVVVAALGTGVLLLVGLETALVIYANVRGLLGRRYQRAVITLAKLRTQGVILRNRLVTSEAEVRLFAGDVEAFETTVMAAMRGAVPPTDISWFRNLRVWTLPHGVAGYNDEHAMMKAILDEKLRRMHQIACQLETKISA